VRILLVSHPPLTRELGAAQIALHLAAALRRRGHQAVAWSPEPLAASSHWQVWRRQREALESHVARDGAYDVVDTPAISASPRLAELAPVVVRSVQPELRYLHAGVVNDLRRGPSPRAIVHLLAATARARAIVAGWRTARRIVCLGTLERDRMVARFPRWRDKIGVYFCAVSTEERQVLLALRRQRDRRPTPNGTRFLWLGRWSAQKGTASLLAFLRARLAACPADSVTIAGCGSHAQREIPAAWLAAGRVRLIPSYGRDELPALLHEHQVGLFTSDVEGWGLSLAEMLEAGMPVYATRAGAVPDLAPYFPSSLHALPPPQSLEPGPLEDLEDNGYLQRFDWNSIAVDYEAQVAAACR